MRNETPFLTSKNWLIQNNLFLISPDTFKILSTDSRFNETGKYL